MKVKIQIPTARQLAGDLRADLDAAQERIDRALADAQRDARHSAEDTAAMHAETDAVIETATYALLIFLCCLLAVLAITPTT